MSAGVRNGPMAARALAGAGVFAAYALLSGVAAGQTFTPGGQELFAVDFTKAPIGSLPGSIRRLSGTMDLVNNNGTTMLRATERSEFLITLPNYQRLPQNFTIEVDIVPKDCCPPPDLTLEGTAVINQGVGSAHLLWTADATFGHVEVIGGANDNREFQIPDAIRATLPGALDRVGVSVEGGTIRMFTNGQQLYAVQAQFARGSVLRVTLGGQTDDGGIKPVYLARFRVATGAPVMVATALPASTGGTITPMAPAASATSGGTSSASSLGRVAPTAPTVVAGAAPTGFAVASSTPASVTFTWNAAPNATGFTLLRSTGAGQPWTTVATTPAATTTYVDANAVDYKTTYVYRLHADYANSSPGFADVTVSLPPPSDPANFTSLVVSPDVHLSWQAVPGASAYLLSGPGLANGVTVSGVSYVVSNAPIGNDVYRIASVFGPAGVLTPNNAWPATSARVAPVPLVPFLTMKNGSGNNGYAVAHEAWSGVCWLDPSPLGGMDCIAPSRLYNLEGVLNFWGKKDPGVSALSFATVLAETMAFADPLDLGGGRRVWCGGRSGGVLCIASSHGPAPGTPQFNNPQQAADAAAMNAENRGYTVITQRRDDGKFFFYQFGFTGGVDPGAGVSDPLARFRAQLQNSASLQSGSAFASTLDTQGAKHAPHVCLSCHGGRFNTADNSIIGGSLLPIDPSRLVFSSTTGFTRADQEANIRRTNGFVAMAGTPTVKEYVDGMYGNPRSLTVANTTAVPAGWKAQQGLWNSVIRPYCIMCHMAQTGPLAFASFNDLVVVKNLVQKVVCNDATMPHSELLFRDFWSAGGSVLLPGLLSAALGFRSCP